MIRVHVICEGPTEETFVNDILNAPFTARGIYLYPSLIGKPGHKGGRVKFERLLTDLRIRLRQDTAAYCTTFFDYYGLSEDFPGKAEAANEASSAARASLVNQKFVEALRAKLGDEPMRRFIPYVQMYEFEGLLFSDPEAFARGLDQASLTAPLARIRDGFTSPEDINDSPMTAPSKRIERLLPSYQKPLHGSLAAYEIGLETIRAKCSLFDEWLSRIEGLGA